MELFPEKRIADPEALADGDRLLQIRALVSQALEKARAEKVITNNLEAAVTLQLADANERERWSSRLPELEEFLILSELHLEPGGEVTATISKTSAPKCERCWRHRGSVGQSATHPTLCDRCVAAVTL
jgi:isoleucyl-tRNA synthetase